MTETRSAIDRALESRVASLSALHDIADQIVQAVDLVDLTLRSGGKVLVFGNGGSAADSQHLAAELVGRFDRDRPGLAAVALTTDTSALTAIANDFGYEEVFRRQVEALARRDDTCIGISTSGRSPNVVRALARARELGLRTIAFVGRDGGALVEHADVAVRVPSVETALVQEGHIAVAHMICEELDRRRLGPVEGAP